MWRFAPAALAVFLLVTGCSSDTGSGGTPPPPPQDVLKRLDDLTTDPCATRAAAGNPAAIGDPWTCGEYVGKLRALDGDLNALAETADAEYRRKAVQLHGLVEEFQEKENRCAEPGTPNADTCAQLLVSLRQALSFVRDETATLAGTPPATP